MKVSVSILIPVRNEAANLPRCLASVAWASEIFVVDSASSDQTVAIAEAAGARVVQFEFSGTWPKKKNWSLENLPFRNDWVFILDADEVLPAEAEEEIRRLIAQPVGHAGYWINRRLMFMGRWMKHSYYPNWNLRLFKHALGRYEKLTDSDTASGDNEVHEHVMVQGTTGFLKSEMDHYAFPSVAVFVEKHNRYSNWEARVEVEGAAKEHPGLQSSRVLWRRRLKNLARRLPCRSGLRFFYVYVFQRGFLDGREGFYFARLHGIYESLTQAKVFELRKTLPPPSTAAVAPARGQILATWLFGAFLVATMFFILRPSIHGERVGGLPTSLGQWINRHDALSNYAAFTVLALLLYCARLPIGRETYSWWNKLARLLSPMRTRAALFCGLMVLVEFVQFLVPGRVYDVRDVLAGWLGALTAAIIWKTGERITRHRSGQRLTQGVRCH